MDHIGLADLVSILPWFVGNLDFLCEIIGHSHTKMVLLIRLLAALSPHYCVFPVKRNSTEPTLHGFRVLCPHGLFHATLT